MLDTVCELIQYVLHLPKKLKVIFGEEKKELMLEISSSHNSEHEHQINSSAADMSE